MYRNSWKRIKCRHKVWQRTCATCRGKSFCIHERRKETCYECCGKQICEHHRRRSRCADCRGLLSVAEALFSSAKARAKKQHLVFDFSVQDVLIWLGDGVCPVLGLRYSHNTKINDKSPTIDRFNSKIGYTKENCCVMSYLANSIKRNATPEQLRKIAEWVTKREHSLRF